MKMIYIGEAHPSLHQVFDFIAKDNNEALQYMRHSYKAGNQKFYIDADNFSILSAIETLYNSGKMKHIKIAYHNRLEKMASDYRKKLGKWIEIYE